MLLTSCSVKHLLVGLTWFTDNGNKLKINYICIDCQGCFWYVCFKRRCGYRCRRRFQFKLVTILRNVKHEPGTNINQMIILGLIYNLELYFYPCLKQLILRKSCFLPRVMLFVWFSKLTVVISEFLACGKVIIC